jgi:hypothetical protein
VAFFCRSVKYAGTVITASCTGTPRHCSAMSFIFISTRALISCGRRGLPRNLMRTGSRASAAPSSRPISRLTSIAMRSGSAFSPIPAFAGAPTVTVGEPGRSQTTDGVDAPSFSTPGSARITASDSSAS